jgi:uncharacterized damage-inducible protein DinB
MANHLLALFRGQGAHADPVAAIEDVSAALANRRPENFPHSIAALVFHMNYWMNYELRRIRGEAPPYPEHNAESFPPPEGATLDWDWLKLEFARLLKELAQIAESSPGQLHRPMLAVDPRANLTASTVESVLWEMVAHNSYHTGQIAMIRRMANAWPPKAGGDSW